MLQFLSKQRNYLSRNLFVNSSNSKILHTARVSVALAAGELDISGVDGVHGEGHDEEGHRGVWFCEGPFQSLEPRAIEFLCDVNCEVLG